MKKVDDQELLRMHKNGLTNTHIEIGRQ